MTVEPERTSFSQAGGACEPPESHSVDPPATERVMNSIAPLGFTARITCAALVAVDCRSMTPAFA